MGMVLLAVFDRLIHLSKNHVDLCANQIVRQLRKSIVVPLGPPQFDGQVPTLHVAELTQNLK
jgi:hypothetical protein